MKRSSYNQIIDWNKRRGTHARLGIELVSNIKSLGMDAEKVISTSPIFLELIPIRLVTTLEVFLRGVISELVNGREEYFERGEKLARGAKVDLAFAAHVNRRELTIGDFVAHTVSLNTVDSVLSVLDTLLDNFVAKIQLSHPRWSEQANEWPLPPIIENYDLMMKSLTRLYSVRHILTHELPQISVLEQDEIKSLVDATVKFIQATDWVVVEALHGAVPLTQMRMNMDAGDEMRQAERKLSIVMKEISALAGIDAKVLEALQTDWEKWADSQAALVASQVEGGSMYPMMWASEKAKLISERAEQLTRLSSEWLES